MTWTSRTFKPRIRDHREWQERLEATADEARAMLSQRRVALDVAYHHYPGLKQRCGAHLLQAIHALKIWYPEDGGLAR